MSSFEKKSGESICDYVFTRVDSLLSELSRPRTAFSVFVLHCSFYVLVSDLLEKNGLSRHFEAQLLKKTQAFSDPKRMQKLWYDVFSAMSPMYALLAGDYSDICGISEYLKHAALFSFEHFDESSWESQYEQPFLNAGADVIEFALDALEQYKRESLAASASAGKARFSRAPYIVAIIAVVAAVVAVIVAISASSSVSSAHAEGYNAGFRAGASISSGVSNTVSESATDEPLTEYDLRPVWITASGGKYHLRSCRVISGRTVERTTRIEAEKAGYTACSKCKP